MGSFADLVAQVDGQEPRRVTARLLLDQDAFDRLADLERQLEQALQGQVDDDDVTVVGPAALADQIRGLVGEQQPTEFVFRALPGHVYDDMVLDHPHPEDPRRGVGPSFWPAVMAACCVVPEGAGDVDGWVALLAKLNSAQQQVLKDAVQEANRGGIDLRPSWAATALIRGTRPTSTTAHLEESRSLDSEDE